jgi:hypothetical protein
VGVLGETHDRVSGPVLGNNISTKVSISGISFLLVIHKWQGGSISVSFNYLEKTECYLYIVSPCIYPSISNKTESQESRGANLKSHSMFSIRSFTSPHKVFSKCYFWHSNYVYIELITNSSEIYKGKILNSNTRLTTYIKFQLHHV